MGYVAIADRDHDKQVRLEPGPQGHRNPVWRYGDLRRSDRTGSVGDDAAATGLSRLVLVHQP